MAKVYPANVAPDAYPRVRGVMLTLTGKNGHVVQKWPKPAGPPKTWVNQWNVAQWSIAARWAANAEPMSMETARFLSKGTVWLPRDILMMAAYGKLYELVGPNGEVYHQASHAAPPIVTPVEWFTSASAVLTTNDTGWAGYTMRQFIPNTAISNPGGTKSRLTLQAASTGNPVRVSAMFINTRNPAGDPYDFVTTPIQVKYNGLVSWTIAPGGQIVTDEIAYAPASGDDVVISFYFQLATDLRRATSAPGWQVYYKFGNDASTVNASGYSPWFTADLVSKLETFHPAP